MLIYDRDRRWPAVFFFCSVDRGWPRKRPVGLDLSGSERVSHHSMRLRLAAHAAVSKHFHADADGWR